MCVDQLSLHSRAHLAAAAAAATIPAPASVSHPPAAHPPCLNPHTRAGVQTLESLLPGLQIDVELLKASDWARLVVDISGTANKIILLKTLYPRADLTAVVQRSPATLMWSAEELTDNAVQVRDFASCCCRTGGGGGPTPPSRWRCCVLWAGRGIIDCQGP